MFAVNTMRLHIEQTLSNKAILIFEFLLFAAFLAIANIDGLSKSVLCIGVILFSYKMSLSFLINRYHSATTIL